jgi:hypothetical protein
MELERRNLPQLSYTQKLLEKAMTTKAGPYQSAPGINPCVDGDDGRVSAASVRDVDNSDLDNEDNRIDVMPTVIVWNKARGRFAYPDVVLEPKLVQPPLAQKRVRDDGSIQSLNKKKKKK